MSSQPTQAEISQGWSGEYDTDIIVSEDEIELFEGWLIDGKYKHGINDNFYNNTTAILIGSSYIKLRQNKIQPIKVKLLYFWRQAIEEQRQR